MTPDIINIIIGYWIFSTIYSAIRLYFGFLALKKSQKEKPELAETIKHWKGMGRKWLDAMSGHTKMIGWLVCIPMGIILLIAPPIFFPFNIIIGIVSIPNYIKNRKKRKEYAILKTQYKLFDDAIEFMDKEIFHNEVFRENFKTEDEYDSVINEHHSSGMYLRNTLGLWDTKKPLTIFFLANEISHADDMSAILMTAFHRKLNGIPYVTQDIIKEKFKRKRKPRSGNDEITIEMDVNEKPTGND